MQTKRLVVRKNHPHLSARLLCEKEDFEFKINIRENIVAKSEKFKLAQKKSAKTAKWSKTMTKFIINYSSKRRWQMVSFDGPGGCESRGIVDLIAIRKDHKINAPGLKRGDLFEIILIQVKGGSARRPSAEDIERLKKVGRHYKAKHLVLAEWKKGSGTILFKLDRSRWSAVDPREVFE